MVASATVQVSKSEGGAVLGDRVTVARSPLARLRGLLGRSGLARGEGLLIRPCNGVHTWGMQFSIDVVFLDARDCVLRLEPSLPPRRMVPWVRGARQALELPAGTAREAGVVVGSCLRIEGAS